MPYNAKTDWRYDDVVTENDLNRIEQGIADAHDNLAAHIGSGGTAHAAATTTTAGFMSAADKSKLDGIQAGAQVNAVTSVAGKTGAVTLTKADVGLGNVQNYGIASQAQAEAGTDNATYMTPLRTAQAIAAKTGGIPLRVNGGMLEFYDGSGWKPVGAFARSYRTSVNGGSTVATVFSLSGAGMVRKIQIFTQTSGMSFTAAIEIDGVIYSQFLISYGSYVVDPFGSLLVTASSREVVLCNLSFKQSFVVKVISIENGGNGNFQFAYDLF